MSRSLPVVGKGIIALAAALLMYTAIGVTVENVRARQAVVTPASGMDVALSSLGASVNAGSHPHVNASINNLKLIDGNAATYSATAEYAQTNGMSATRPDSWIITLDKTYNLNTVKVQLLDTSFNNQYAYKVEASTDGTNWKTVMDRTAHAVRSLQVDIFDDMQIRYFRITGHHATPSSELKVVEFIAYHQITPTNISILDKPRGDVALESKGARGWGGQYPVYTHSSVSATKMIDGDTSRSGHYTMQYIHPGNHHDDNLFIELDRHYNINTLKILLNGIDADLDEYKLNAYVSADGKTWKKVLNDTLTDVKGLRVERFEDSIVKFIMIEGVDAETDTTRVPNKLLRVIEVEALHDPSPRFTKPKTDVALSSRGAVIAGGSSPFVNRFVNNQKVIDGLFTKYSGIKEFAQTNATSPVKDENRWTIKLDKAYTVNMVRIRLLDDAFFRQYVFNIEASLDGENWTTIMNRSSKAVRSIQAERFADMNVRYLRISSSGSYPGPVFRVVEVETMYEEVADIKTLEKPETDVALKSKGAIAFGGQYPVYDFKGVTNNKMINGGKGNNNYSMQYIHPNNADYDDLFIELDKAYNINTLKIHLQAVDEDLDEYKLEAYVSADGKVWKKVLDDTLDWVKGKRKERFDDSVVRFIRIKGIDAETDATRIPNKLLRVTEVQAYYDKSKQFTKPKNDVVLSQKGAIIVGGSHPNHSKGINNAQVIDGTKTTYSATTGFGQTIASHPNDPANAWTIKLDKAYTLNTAKILLLDDSTNRWATVRVEASLDGQTWTDVINRRAKGVSSLQVEHFADMNIRYFRISSDIASNKMLKVVKLAAYYQRTPKNIKKLVKPTSDVALSSKGAIAYGGQYPVYYPTVTNAKMIDGSFLPGEVTMQYIHPNNSEYDKLFIELDDHYNINTINVRLYDNDVHSDEQSFTVEVSADGINWKTVMDRTSSRVTGFQTQRFKDSIVKFIRINGTDAETAVGNELNTLFRVVEVEALHTQRVRAS